MDIRRIESNEIDQMVPLRDYCFSRKYTGDKLTDYINWTKHSTSTGAFSDDKLVGQMMSLPLSQQLYQHTFKMAGVGFVGVYPEFRSGGVMKQIIKEALKLMREEEQYVSVLGPFSVGYYRKMGWEVMFDSVNYEIDMRDFPEIKLDSVPVFHRFDFKDWPKEKVQTLYNEVAEMKHGWMFRDELWWERLKLREADSYFVLVEDGFMRYRKSGTTFLMEDLVTKTYEAQKQLLHYITLHRSNFFKIQGVSSIHHPLNYFLTAVPCDRLVGNQFMGRIVDVEKTMSVVPVKTTTNCFYLNIQDPLCEWNDGLFKVENGKIERINDQVANDDVIIEISIQALSALFFGYKTIEELRYLNLIECSKEGLNQFSETYQFQPVEIFDHF